MGVHNTVYKRTTVYLKKAQVESLKETLKRMASDGFTKVSMSDLIRAILDKVTGTEDSSTDFYFTQIRKQDEQK